MTPKQLILNELTGGEFNPMAWLVPPANTIRQRGLLDGRANADTVRAMKHENDNLRNGLAALAAMNDELLETCENQRQQIIGLTAENILLHELLGRAQEALNQP